MSHFNLLFYILSYSAHSRCRPQCALNSAGSKFISIRFQNIQTCRERVCQKSFVAFSRLSIKFIIQFSFLRVLKETKFIKRDISTNEGIVYADKAFIRLSFCPPIAGSPTLFCRSAASSLSSDAVSSSPLGSAFVKNKKMKVTLATRLNAGIVGESEAQWLRFRPAVTRQKKWTPRWKGLFDFLVLIDIYFQI